MNLHEIYIIKFLFLNLEKIIKIPFYAMQTGLDLKCASTGISRGASGENTETEVCLICTHN